MASTNGTSRRSSYMALSVKPVEYSLTAGTDIPAPLDSPPDSPVSSGRPPTPGGGPLTSHPTNPNDMPGAFPPTPDPEKESLAQTSSMHSRAKQTRVDSFRTPISPASALPAPTTSSPEYQQHLRRPSGVRKLLSLSSLRSSFSSSRTSLVLPRQSHDVQVQPQPQHQPPTGIKRPSSPSIASTTASSFHQPQPRPPLRSKKSGGNWFKRRSSMFMMSTDALNEVDENSRPDTRDSKRFKETISSPQPLRQATPPPMLPQIGRGSFSGGELGWDEEMFKR